MCLSHIHIKSIVFFYLFSVDDLIALTEAVAFQMMQGNFDRALSSNVATMYANLKLYGAQLEALYKDFLDRFVFILTDHSSYNRHKEADQIMLQYLSSNLVCRYCCSAAVTNKPRPSPSISYFFMVGYVNYYCDIFC